MQLIRENTLHIWTSVEQLNNFYVDRFIESAGFGGVRMTVPTMTLDPMLRLLLGRDINLDGIKVTAMESYKIDALELIGIAKHVTPVAFEMNRHSPFLVNQTRQTTPSRWSVEQTISGTRELTDFEKSALTQLNAGKDVAQMNAPDGSLRLVGAVRAQQACLECHSDYKVGEILGAFSFRLSKSALPTDTSAPVTLGR